jgi:hypothetical protein
LNVLALLSLLLLAAAPASGVMVRGEKTAVPDFFGSAFESAFGDEWPATQYRTRGGVDCSYETALDVRDGPNLYAYVMQNPWTSFDPDGLATFEGDPMMSSRSWVDNNGYINITAGADGSRSTVPDALHAASLELKVNQGTPSLQGIAKERYLASTRNDSELSRGLAWRWAQNPDDLLVNAFLGMSSVGGADKGEGMRVKVPMRTETPSSGRKSMWLDGRTPPPGSSPNSTAKGTASNNTRVGRWMSTDEYAMMQKTGHVQEGSGGLTFASTEGAGSFRSQAKPGAVYAEYDVPSSSLLPGGKDGWVKNVGPNAPKSQKVTLEKRGGEQLPKVENLSEPLETKK